MDINVAVHNLIAADLEGVPVTVKMLERIMEKALEDYTLKKDYDALEVRVARLERIISERKWEVDFTMKCDGTNSIDLKKVLTEAQLFTITDESASGPGRDGKLKTVIVYVVKEDGELIQLPWGRYGDINEKSVEKLREAGIYYMPAGLYYLDEEGVLQCNICKDVRLKMTKVAIPIE